MTISAAPAANTAPYSQERVYPDAAGSSDGPASSVRLARIGVITALATAPLTPLTALPKPAAAPASRCGTSCVIAM